MNAPHPPSLLRARGRALAMVLALLGASALPGGAQPAPDQSPPTQQAAPNQQASPNQKEQLLLERIRQLKAPRWRSYGVCRYDWSAWRLTDGGVRTTDAECGADNSRTVVAVHCDTLQVSRREGEGAWSAWRLPLAAAESKTSGGEDLMVAALCAGSIPLSTKQSDSQETVEVGAAQTQHRVDRIRIPASTRNLEPTTNLLHCRLDRA
jgi:hypothetical protein